MNGPTRQPRLSAELLLSGWPLVLVALALIVLAGGVLRFRGLDWDQPEGGVPLHMHPDERFLSIVANDMTWPGDLGGYIDTSTAPTNPYNLASVGSYVYGTLPLYLGKAVATIAGDDPDGPGNSYDQSAIWGRRVTAFVSTLTIPLVFLIGLALFGRGTALLAALFYSLAILPIQLAHFWAVDPYVTFFGAITVLLSCLLLRRRHEGTRWALYAGIGVAVGFGMASKVAFWPFILVPGLDIAVLIAMREFPRLGLRHRMVKDSQRLPSGWMMDIAGLCFAGFVSILAFRFANPMAFVGPGILDLGINSQWWDALRAEAQRQGTSGDMPPFVQFAARPPYLESLQNMVLWGMGPALGLAAWASVAGGLYVFFRRREVSLLVPVFLSVFFLFFFGGRFVVFMRYFDPLYPLLCILAAWGLLSAAKSARSWSGPRILPRLLRTFPFELMPVVRSSAVVLVGLVVAATAWWALAFQNVYSEEHPRIGASRWMFENIPAGSAVTYEVWDDSLPYSLPGYPSAHQQFRGVPTEPYETDSVAKVLKLIYGLDGDSQRIGLDGADYVVVSSDRIRKSVPRLEREYPATSLYYDLLDSGELGFDLVATFEVRPSFLGVSVNDSSAEESFTVYDHPIVRIYEKSSRWDPSTAASLLYEAYPERAVNLLQGQGRTNGLQFTLEVARAQQAGGTFNDVFDEDGFASKWPALWWFLWLELSAFAVVPFVVWLFRWLPDRGYGLTKILGPSVVALAAWLLVAWDICDFSGSLTRSVFVICLAVGAAAWVVGRNFLIPEARDRWKTWLFVEGVFATVFVVFCGIRALNPDVWYHPTGGEKPMDLAYLTAVIRSTELPPYDPWFSGGSMNYYYWGWYFLAVPIRALKILPEVAFNLGVPTFAALTATVAFSTTYNLAGLTRRARNLASLPWRVPVTVGLLGAFLLVFAGNFDGIHQTVERIQSVNTWGAFKGIPVLRGAVGLAGGTYQVIVSGADLPLYDWWRSSRVHIGSNDITEFPYWAFVFADLHPHLMGLAFFGLVTAMSLASAVSTMQGDRWRPFVLAAALGLAVALVRAVHTWDFPTAALTAAAGIVAGQLFVSGPIARRSSVAGVQLLLFGTFLVGPMLPYTQHTEVFNQGLDQAPERTAASQFFSQFGLFVIIAAAYLLAAYHNTLKGLKEAPGNRRPAWLPVPERSHLPGLVGALSVLAVLTWSDQWTVVAVTIVVELLLISLLVLQSLSSPRDPGLIATTAMFIAGFGIAAGVDVVTVEGDIVRMNTVFKFSLQAWQLLALASAYGLWYAVDTARTVSLRLPRGRLISEGAVVAAVALVAVSAIFLVSGTRARLDARFAGSEYGLDGLAYLDVGIYHEDAGTPDSADDRLIELRDDEPLIRWLRNNVEGSPVVVEAVGPNYHWTGRISVNTGLPAVIGWDWHQQQQRLTYGGLIAERRNDTQQFYRQASVDSAETYLRKYNVRYVVVGTEELIYGSPEGIARLDKVPALTAVFRDGSYAIYEVDQSLLPQPPTTRSGQVRDDGQSGQR